MIRNIDLNAISDGKRYKANDMARLGCDDCSGCSACCQNMEETIILDPYDMAVLTQGLGCSCDALLTKYVELKVIDGLILPLLKMDPATDRCSFLNKEGRCQIHPIRPGICRLFPLGRIYENGGFSYYLQTEECRKTNRTKVKIQKWIGQPEFPRYEKFISDWHYFTKDLSEELSSMTDMEELTKIQSMMLQLFYRKAYDGNRSFYDQFYERLNMIRTD